MAAVQTHGAAIRSGNIDTAAAAINGDYRMGSIPLMALVTVASQWPQVMPLYVECVLHGCSPLLIAVF